MIRNYLIEIDDTHIYFDGWYLSYADTPKYRMSNATIDKIKKTKPKTLSGPHDLKCVSHIDFLIMHYQIQLCNPFNQFKKVEITTLISFIFLEPLKDKIKINFSSWPIYT